MTVLPLSKAARVAGTSRQTIYRYAKQGRISTVQLHDGTLGVDTSELLRVFGSLLQPETVSKTVTSDSVRQAADKPEQADSITVATLQAEIAGLNGKVAILERQVEVSQNREHKLLGIIESQTRLIEHQAIPNHPRQTVSQWKKAVLAIVLGIAAALAWNTVTKEKQQPQKPAVLEPKPQAPNQNLEFWKPDDNGG